MIGAALVREAAGRGTEVYAVVRPDTRRLERIAGLENVRLIESRLEDLGELTAIPPGGYDAFYHLAWAYSAKEKRDDPELQAKNISFALDAVRLARRLGCKKWIGAGSQAEYGWKEERLTPHTACAPESAYGIAKLAAGRLTKKLCASCGMTHIWGRILSVYGSNDNSGTMLDYAIKCFLRRETATFSPAAQPWDYLHESDAGRAFYLLGEGTACAGDYLIASGSEKPLKTYILTLARYMDASELCCFKPQADMPSPGLRADIDKLRADAGFTPRLSFHEGIKETVEAYRARWDGDGRSQ